jgi:hypothetical protein
MPGIISGLFFSQIHADFPEVMPSASRFIFAQSREAAKFFAEATALFNSPAFSS